MASGGGPDEERGHRGRNTELRRSISDMNLTLRRRQGNQASNDSRRSGNAANSGGAQDRKNIVSMIASETRQVRDKEGQRGGKRACIIPKHQILEFQIEQCSGG